MELRYDVEPTDEGKKRWPSEGIYYGDAIFNEFVDYQYHAPCSCQPECALPCNGACGCAACWLAEFG